MESPSKEDSPLHVTTKIPSQPPLVSVSMSALSLSSELESTIEKISSERQAPDLAEGEVDKSQNLEVPCEAEKLTIESQCKGEVRNDEIIQET